MNRREYIKASLLAAGAVGTRSALSQSGTDANKHQPFPPPPRGPGGERMPNILWICTDQQRADTIGGFNNPHIHTPRLRRLMDESVTFTNAFAQTPICSPHGGASLQGVIRT